MRILKLIEEHGFWPVRVGAPVGVDGVPIFGRIEVLGRLPDGWHFGEGRRPSAEVVNLARDVASFAVLHGAMNCDAFPGKGGEITVAVYVGAEDHSFQIRNDLSIRYWSESETDGEMEEGLSLERAQEEIRILLADSWKSFSSFTSDFGTGITGTFEVKHSRIRATAESQSSSAIALCARAAACVITLADFTQGSAPNPQSSGSLTIPDFQMGTA